MRSRSIRLSSDLLNEQGAGAGVGESDGLGIASSDLNGAGSILTNQVAIRCLDLSNGVVAGSQALDSSISELDIQRKPLRSRVGTVQCGYCNPVFSLLLRSSMRQSCASRGV